MDARDASETELVLHCLFSFFKSHFLHCDFHVNSRLFIYFLSFFRTDCSVPWKDRFHDVIGSGASIRLGLVLLPRLSDGGEGEGSPVQNHY